MRDTNWHGMSEPQDPAEDQAVTRALMAHRHDEEASEALRGLTPFEIELAEAAYYAGIDDGSKPYLGAIGPAAETVRADYLRSLQPLSGPRFRALLPRGLWPEEVKAGNMVLRARRAAERHDEGNT